EERTATEGAPSRSNSDSISFGLIVSKPCAEMQKPLGTGSPAWASRHNRNPFPPISSARAGRSNQTAFIGELLQIPDRRQQARALRREFLSSQGSCRRRPGFQILWR